MSWRRYWNLIRRAAGHRAADRDLDDEIRFHLDAEARLQAERGLPPEQARTAARRAFGSVARAKEDTRAVWISTTVEQIARDLRFGSRILTKSPALSATAVALIALVIGGNTTVFSIAHGILHKPSAGVHASGLATVSWVAESGAIETVVNHRIYTHFREQAAALRPIAAFDFDHMTLTHPDGSYAMRAVLASPNYFDTLGARLARGRSFSAAEARPEAGLVVIVGHHVWQNLFHGNDQIVGHPVAVNGVPATIVGVAEPRFRGALLAEQTDIWVPLTGQIRDRLQPTRRGANVTMIGRLAPGASLTEATTELSALWEGLRRAEPDLDHQFRVRLVPYSATAGGNSLVATRGHQMLAIFSVVTLLTVAIVCANIANLLIARAVVRQRELALRQSLGASRVRIIRALLAEGLVLSVVAWVGACVFAWWASRTVVTFIVPPSQTAFMTPDLGPDWTVVGYALALAVLCTVAVTLGPALRTRPDRLLQSLRVGEPGVVRGRSRLSNGLVVLQLAFSVLLLTSAGLAYRSLSLQDSLDVGFETSRILLATVNTAGSAEAPEANAMTLRALDTRLAELPGVDAVSFIPGRRFTPRADFPVRRDVNADAVLATDKAVGDHFFATVGVPLLAGRDFGAARGKTDRTAIITRHLAVALWPGDPGEAAVGKTLVVGHGQIATPVEVIGVVQDAFFAGRGTDAPPRYIFFPSGLTPAGETTFYVRHRGASDAAASSVARALRETDPGVAIANLRSLDAQIAEDVSPIWVLTTLLAIFAGGSLLIAGIGQYAVVAFDGQRRTREFGLRIALGASPGQLVTSVLSEGLRVTAVGLAIGFLLSGAVAMVLVRVLYGITPTDLPTYAGVFLLLAAASAVACYLPARRAARTDPLVALRTE